VGSLEYSEGLSAGRLWVHHIWLPQFMKDYCGELLPRQVVETLLEDCAADMKEPVCECVCALR
jgi:hypothetical protein